MMNAGQRHRAISLLGTVAITSVAAEIANAAVVQATIRGLHPQLARFPAKTLTGDSFAVALSTALLITAIAFVPLYKPRPRRILNTIAVTQRQVLLTGALLATIGYYDYTYRLPRITLTLLIGVLLVTLPLWFAYIRERPIDNIERTIIVGDNANEIERVIEATSDPVVGYVAPPSVKSQSQHPMAQVMPDGGVETLDELTYLGDVVQLERVLIGRDIDRVIFAFSQPNREVFFATLALCHENGVKAMIHRRKAESVLVSGEAGEELVNVALEPWDWQDRLFKRLFDMIFAGVGLVILSPVIAAIGLAIKLDSSGPIFYTQERTTEFGDVFRIWKFRSMVTDAEAQTGAVISGEDAGDVDTRVTKVGRFLRETHLDEIPQLWSILIGDMSVVGPRPERPEIDWDIQGTLKTWQQRWFVKPGLTGLAQINGVTGHDPEQKLEYDILYVRNQSLWYDLKIVARELWQVGEDALSLVR